MTITPSTETSSTGSATRTRSRRRIDPTTTPKRIELEYALPDGDLYYVEGIYEIVDDRLRLALSSAEHGDFREGRFTVGPPPKSFDEAGAKTLVLQRATSLPEPFAVFGFESQIRSPAFVEFDETGRCAICLDRHFFLFNFEDGTVLHHREHPAYDFVCSPFFPGGKRMALGSAEEVVIHDLSTVEIVHRESGFERVEISADGKTMFLWGDNESAKALDAIDFAEKFRVVPEQGAIVDVAFSPDGKLIAVRMNSPAQVALYEVASGDLVRTLQLSPEDTERTYQDFVAFDPTGSHLAAAELIEEAARVSRWNVATGAREGTYPSSLWPSAIAFSPDGTSIASGDARGTIDVWDLKTRTRAATYRPVRKTDHDLQAVESLVYSPDGKYLAAGGPCMCHVWRLGASEEMPPSLIWPEWDPEARRREIERTDRFADPKIIERYFDREKRVIRRPADYRGEAGNPTVSWRVDLLDGGPQAFVKNAVRTKEPWDSAWNRQALKMGADAFSTPGIERGKTNRLLATGPTTPFSTDAEAPSDISGITIFIVETTPDRAVPWSEPREYVFDPERPRAGLPPNGFHAILRNGSCVYIRKEIPDAELRTLFTAQEEEGEAETFARYVEVFYARLYRPQVRIE